MASAKKTQKSLAKVNTDHVNIQETNNLLGKLYVCYLKDKVCLLNLKGEKSKGGENHESLKTPLTLILFSENDRFERYLGTCFKCPPIPTASCIRH